MGYPPEGISVFGLSKMMMGVWIGMVSGVSKRICLLVTGFLQDPVLLIGICISRLRRMGGGCCSAGFMISSAQIVILGPRISSRMMVGVGTALCLDVI
jgi:hypothetical protein